MRLALYAPDIPQNTGTILRLAACLGVAVDIIGPAGFDLTDRALRRAALDYLDHVEITRHSDFAEFEDARSGRGSRLVLLSTRAVQAHAGVPEPVHAAADASICIPMRPALRSLNVAVAAAMVLGEALRQTQGFPPETDSSHL
jgi:tRNA (cytidine/uridine-2'-O-)-methyltransferase